MQDTVLHTILLDWPTHTVSHSLAWHFEILAQ